MTSRTILKKWEEGYKVRNKELGGFFRIELQRANVRSTSRVEHRILPKLGFA